MTTDDPIDVELRRLLRRALRSSACPPDERWLALSAGELAAEEAETLRRHLGDCAACAGVAADAQRFLRAMDAPRPAAQRVRLQRWVIAAGAAAAAAAVIATAVGLGWPAVSRRAPDPVADFVAELEPPALPAAGGDATADELVYRGSESSTAQSSRDAALTPYRVREYAAACRALAEHGQRFPADREARYLGAVACLKAGEVDRGEGALASLAAVAGERREDARALLEGLRSARRREAR